MSMNKFLKAAKVVDSDFVREELEYSYENEKGKIEKDKVIIGIRKRTPAYLIQESGGFRGDIDQMAVIAGMVFLLDDDGNPTTLTPEQVKGFDIDIVNSISELITKNRTKRDEAKGKS